MDNKQNFIITIGRQFGSGGRELGRKLAERFGIEYYDKNLLMEAARSAGVDPDFFLRSDEKFPTFVSGAMSFTMGYSPLPWYNESAISDDSIYRKLTDVMTSIADRTSCIFVGRSADYVLRNHPSPRVDIFVHAPMEECVKRIMKRGDKLTPDAARSLAEKTNKLRSHYYNFYTDKRWGDAATYDLTLDSSKLSMDAIADIVADYIRLRFGIDPVRG